MVAELLQTCQHCGVPGNTIFEAAATVREAIAHAELTSTPLCILSLDFQEAFDKVSRTYLFTILQSYGFSERFIERIKCMYENAVSSVQVHGHISGPIPIRYSVRQGCPISMLLFFFFFLQFHRAYFILI